AGLGDLAVAELAALVVDHDPHDRADAVDDAVALPLGARGRGGRVEGELHPGRSLVGVLDARAPGRGKADEPLRSGDPQRRRHLQVVVGHPPMLACRDARHPLGSVPTIGWRTRRLIPGRTLRWLLSLSKYSLRSLNERRGRPLRSLDERRGTTADNRR